MGSFDCSDPGALVMGNPTTATMYGAVGMGLSSATLGFCSSLSLFQPLLAPHVCRLQAQGSQVAWRGVGFLYSCFWP